MVKGFVSPNREPQKFWSIEKVIGFPTKVSFFLSFPGNTNTLCDSPRSLDHITYIFFSRRALSWSDDTAMQSLLDCWRTIGAIVPVQYFPWNKFRWHCFRSWASPVPQSSTVPHVGPCHPRKLVSFPLERLIALYHLRSDRQLTAHCTYVLWLQRILSFLIFFLLSSFYEAENWAYFFHCQRCFVVASMQSQIPTIRERLGLASWKSGLIIYSSIPFSHRL